MSAKTIPIKGELSPCDTQAHIVPFIITGQALRVTPRMNGFMVEMKGSNAKVHVFTYNGKQAPEWLVSGAMIEVDFEKNSITLLEKPVL